MPRQLAGGVLSRVVASVAAAVGVAASPAAAELVVDDFTDTILTWPFDQATVGSTFLLGDTGLSGVLGGRRHVGITAETIDLPGLDLVSVAVVPGAGVFDYASSAGADGNVSLAYPGPTGSGDLNADLSGLSAIEIDLLAFDFANAAPLEVDVTLFDGPSFSTVTKYAVTPGAQPLLFPLGDFTGIGLTSIDSILFVFDPGVAADFRLGEIRAIPGPPAVALLGAAGLFARARRRRSHR
jgi:hypothetical protein